MELDFTMSELGHRAGHKGSSEHTYDVSEETHFDPDGRHNLRIAMYKTTKGWASLSSAHCAHTNTCPIKECTLYIY